MHWWYNNRLCRVSLELWSWRKTTRSVFATIQKNTIQLTLLCPLILMYAQLDDCYVWHCTPHTSCLSGGTAGLCPRILHQPLLGDLVLYFTAGAGGLSYGSANPPTFHVYQTLDWLSNAVLLVVHYTLYVGNEFYCHRHADREFGQWPKTFSGVFAHDARSADHVVSWTTMMFSVWDTVAWIGLVPLSCQPHCLFFSHTSIATTVLASLSHRTWSRSGFVGCSTSCHWPLQ